MFNTIMNTVWYIFTILFILYRFTTFFSHAYNFLRFCGKLISGGKYVCGLCINYFKQKEIIQPETEVIDETNIDNDQIDVFEDKQNNSFLGKIKSASVNIYYGIYHRIFGKHHPQSQENYVELPMYKSSHIHESNDLQNINKNIINSYSKNQNYSSLIQSNYPKSSSNYESYNYPYHNNHNHNHNHNITSSLYNKHSHLLYNIPMDESINSEIIMPKPFGLDDSTLLLESSFINTKINNNHKKNISNFNNNRNLPFATSSSFISTNVHPLYTNDDDYSTDDDNMSETNKMYNSEMNDEYADCHE